MKIFLVMILSTILILSGCSVLNTATPKNLDYSICDDMGHSEIDRKNECLIILGLYNNDYDSCKIADYPNLPPITISYLGNNTYFAKEFCENKKNMITKRFFGGNFEKVTKDMTRYEKEKCNDMVFRQINTQASGKLIIVGSCSNYTKEYYEAEKLYLGIKILTNNVLALAETGMIESGRTSSDNAMLYNICLDENGDISISRNNKLIIERKIPELTTSEKLCISSKEYNLIAQKQNRKVVISKT
jgi:hypothetical protein